MAKFNNFQWEDEDDTEQTHAEPQEGRDDSTGDDEFARLFAQESPHRATIPLRIGAQVEGTILSLTGDSDTVLVELSPSQTGVMDRADLEDEEGTIKVQIGDRITTYITSLKQGIMLSSSLGRSHQASQDLEMAYRNKIPVKGKVTKDNKGGFEVTIFGKIAFCPISQIDSRFVENKAEYINKDFEFLIEKWEENGRNIVVSRQALLKRQGLKRLEELKALVGSEEVLSGTVTDLKDFGAMVDLGGIDGMVHISELSYARVGRPGDILTRGETVRVKILSIDDQGERPRISLSMKAVEQDPWLTIHEEFKQGGSYEGKVLSFGKHGAFVQLKPGIDGMIHLSEMSWEKRIYQPSDVLNLGDTVSVRILSIDGDQKRMSLSLKDIKDDPWRDIEDNFKPGTVVKVQIERLKGFGAIAQLRSGVTGLIPMASLRAVYGEAFRKHCSPPKELEAIVVRVDLDEKKVLLNLPGAEEDQEQDLEYRQFLGQKAPNSAESNSKRGSFGDLLLAAQTKK